jgi:transposase
LAAYDRGMKTTPIARLFQVSASWARRVKQRRRETGETGPRPRGTPGVRRFDRVRLAELVRQRPDATLQELRDQLGAACATSAICEALKVMGLTLKKKRSTPRSRTGRTSRRGGRNGDRSCRT